MRRKDLRVPIAFAVIAVLLISMDASGGEPLNDSAVVFPEVRLEVGKEGRPLTVPASIWGTEVLFLVDTGAAKSAIDLQLALKNQTVIGYEIVNTSSGSSAVPKFQCDHLVIRGLELAKDAEVLGVELSEIRQITGEQIHGVLGMDILRRFTLAIDFDDGTLVISDRLRDEQIAGAK